MDKYLSANQQLWNAWTDLHEDAEFYDLAGFKAGRSSLRPIERAELTAVAGRSLLHLQCHFGLDTLSWARAGATVTGVDLSDRSIALARSLAAELAIPATFVCADIAHLPDALAGEFDIVFTSYGVLPWLRDLRRWGEVVAHFLKPGGIFYLVDDHPFMRTLSALEGGQLAAANPYFFDEQPSRIEARGSYAAPGDAETPLRQWYIWNHSLGEILDALIGSGLRIEFVHEFPFAMRAKFPGMQRGDDGTWRFARPPEIPLLFSLQARKPAAPETTAPIGEVRLRDVAEEDLPIFFVHQDDPIANRMAAFPARERAAFMAHWARILADPTLGKQTILLDDEVAGNIVSFTIDGEREVGYWVGRQHWGRGVATRALAAFLPMVTERPLYAHVAKANRGSLRVLQKCGFAVTGEGVGDDGVEEYALTLFETLS
jgi:RimJ/RimL family protein N-acetyltransferase/SAM-dependent methyltransferase